ARRRRRPSRARRRGCGQRRAPRAVHRPRRRGRGRVQGEEVEAEPADVQRPAQRRRCWWPSAEPQRARRRGLGRRRGLQRGGAARRGAGAGGRDGGRRGGRADGRRPGGRGGGGADPVLGRLGQAGKITSPGSTRGAQMPGARRAGARSR
ncbi:unnamed protein product, partial [Prorocentrum cordatum]